MDWNPSPRYKDISCDPSKIVNAFTNCYQYATSGPFEGGRQGLCPNYPSSADKLSSIGIGVNEQWACSQIIIQFCLRVILLVYGSVAVSRGI